MGFGLRFCDQCLGAFRLLKHRLAPLIESLPDIGHPEASAGSFDQPHTETCLQPGNPAAEL